MAITTEPDRQGGSPEIEMVGPLHTAQDVLNLVAIRYLNIIGPSTQEALNGFVDYLENVKKALIVDIQPGSLIITVNCRSLQILKDLWDDYCSGRVNEMAQKFLVTEELLDELNLKEAKLTTTIPEEEYRACRETLLLFSGELKVWYKHVAFPQENSYVTNCRVSGAWEERRQLSINVECFLIQADGEVDFCAYDI